MTAAAAQDLGYRPFDADNHYYEALDAFTRHVEASMQPRVVQWVDIGGRKHHLVGGRLARAVANPTWDPIAKPGALRDYFKGNPDGRNPAEMLRDREPLPEHYMDPQARLQVMDAQGLCAVWLFPTLGVLYEELLRNDVDAVVAMMRGFNRWLLRRLGIQLLRPHLRGALHCAGRPGRRGRRRDRPGARARGARRGDAPRGGHHPQRSALTVPHHVRPGVAAPQRRRRHRRGPRSGLGLLVAGVRRRRVLRRRAQRRSVRADPTCGPSPSSAPRRTG